MKPQADLQPDCAALAGAHHLPAADVIVALDVDPAAGLSQAEADRRLGRFGPNTIRSRRRVRKLSILLHQLASPVVYLLAAAAALSFYFREWPEGIAVLLVLLFNTLIGFFTEIRAARSMEALRSLGTRSARVLRDGTARMVAAADLVPGDVVLLDAGDSVSADLRLLSSSSVAADESTFTGESVPVDKSPEPVGIETRLADRRSMLFKGTSTIRGSGRAVVVGTGINTELGNISRLVEDANPERSPLEKSLARLSGQLLWLTLALALALVGLGIAQGHDPLRIVTTAIALAVAAIPEGLPVVATLALARGMWRMARRNALVERLSAVETLGATTLILTDKTGTLTENRMSVAKAVLPSGTVDAHAFGSDGAVRALLQIAALCNEASLGGGDAGTSGDVGDPMELALLRAAGNAGLERRALLEKLPPVRACAFDTATRMMATVHRCDGRFLFAVKGAPEAVLAACDSEKAPDGDHAMTDDVRDAWMGRVQELGAQGLRVLALASKVGGDCDAPPYRDLALLGIVGLEDPARGDVPAAIRDCQRAGVRVVMMTGDHAVTARSIGQAVGLAGHDALTVEGTDLAQLGSGRDGELLAANIFARVEPSEKLALVNAYQNHGEIVAMTGDGVNDAPALRQADIGVAMGQRGTDVAREASAMVLLDDAFPTIVLAIREGRVIFGNIRRFAAFLLSCNLSEVLIVGLAVALGLPLPILPLQILYLNLVTDVFPAFALAAGEGDDKVMQHPPRPPGEPILGRAQWRTIVLHGLVLTGATFAAMAMGKAWLKLDQQALVTVTFLTLAFSQLAHVFNMRNAASGLLGNEITRNRWVWGALALCTALLAIPPYLPGLAGILGLARPDASMWAVIVAASCAPVVLIQAAMMAIHGLRRAGR
ncbi:cation-transporting P-type ATPase [Novosphingobium sp. ZN18A2]|uniref:cation-translocating P-type ATPase n=1 Tax=Novosphingobium sp. ZN18A2 TaxID=3079861 RepID=UPI0030CFEF0D